jgi:CHASE2 domain
MAKIRRALQQRLPVAAGAATLAVFLAAAILLPKSMSEMLRDGAFDIVLAGGQPLRRPAPSDLKVIVVDIDRASIDALGTWPWPRETMARLVEAVAAGRPAAIAIDVLFAEPDDRSQAALARRLGLVTGRAEISTLGESLPDGDKRLARAISSVPVALGFVLDPRSRRRIAWCGDRKPRVPAVRRFMAGRGRDRADAAARRRGKRPRYALITWQRRWGHPPDSGFRRGRSCPNAWSGCRGAAPRIGCRELSH